MLAGSVELPDEMRHLPVPTISIDGLFMSGRPSYFQRRPGPLGILNGGVVTNGGLISPQSEMQMSAPTTPPMNATMTQTAKNSKTMSKRAFAKPRFWTTWSGRSRKWSSRPIAARRKKLCS